MLLIASSGRYMLENKVGMEKPPLTVYKYVLLIASSGRYILEIEVGMSSATFDCIQICTAYRQQRTSNV